MKKPSILIVDDHILFNDGIKELLSEEFEIVGQVFDGKNAMRVIELQKPQAILLDINLPSINGLELVKLIRNSESPSKIIFLTMYDELKFVNQAKEMKIDGYLLKNSTKEELIEGINAVLKGGKYYDSKISEVRETLHHGDQFVKLFSLTPREVEIIKMIKEGVNTAQIAERLFLAHETVKTHRKNIYYKLKIEKVVDLIKFAIENKL